MKNFKDSWFKGVFFGGVLPWLILGVFYLVFNSMGMPGGLEVYENTTLFILAMNGLWFFLFNIRGGEEKTGRGLMLMTMIYALTYVIVFYA